MSIGIGLVCDGGIVLTADEEITDGNIKRPGEKIAVRFLSEGLTVAVAVAGYYHVAAYAGEVMFRDATGTTHEEIIASLRESLRKVYEDHVCLSYDATERPSVLQLLVAVAAQGEAMLYVSERSILRRIAPFEFIGVGKELASYLIRKKCEAKPGFRLTLPEGIAAAKEIAHEVQKNVPYCGQGTSVLVLQNNGESYYN